MKANPMRIYISTPISGRGEPSFEEKRQVAYRRVKMLSAYIAEEWPEAEIRSPFDAVPLNEECSESVAIGRCINIVLTCDAILLDRGWNASRGCNLEYRAAKIYDLEIIDGNGQLGSL